jgi:hypothetical protein
MMLTGADRVNVHGGAGANLLLFAELGTQSSAKFLPAGAAFGYATRLTPAPPESSMTFTTTPE